MNYDISFLLLSFYESYLNVCYLKENHSNKSYSMQFIQCSLVKRYIILKQVI